LDAAEARWTFGCESCLLAGVFATPYDKLEAKQLAFIKFATIRIWLHAYYRESHRLLA
jgi:hypothetical protein